MSETRDGGLIEALDRGELDALGRVVELYGRVVYNTCLRVLGNAADAEDASQATFLVLLRKHRNLRRETVLAAWLHGTAQFVARRYLRSLQRRKRHEKEAGAMIEAKRESTNRLWEKASPELDREIAALPARYRNVLVLSYLQGRTRSEIAGQLGVPEGTVGTWLARGKEKMRARLAKHGVSMSVAVLGALLAERAAEAAPPAALLPAVKAAAGLAGGTGMAAAAGKAVLIAEQAMKAALWFKLKLAIGTVVAAAAVGTIGVAAGRQAAGERAVGDPKPPAPAKAKEDSRAYSLCHYEIICRLKLSKKQKEKAAALYEVLRKDPARGRILSAGRAKFLAASRKVLSRKQLAELEKGVKTLSEIKGEYERKRAEFQKELEKIETEVEKKLTEEVGPRPRKDANAYHARIVGLLSAEQKGRFEQAIAAFARASGRGRATPRQFVEELGRIMTPEQKARMQRWKSLLNEKNKKYAELNARKRQAAGEMVKKMIAKGADTKTRYVSWAYLGNQMKPEALLRGMKLSDKQHAALRDARLQGATEQRRVRASFNARYHKKVYAEVLTAEQRMKFDEGHKVAWPYAVKIAALQERVWSGRLVARRDLDKAVAMPPWYHHDSLPGGGGGGSGATRMTDDLRRVCERLKLTAEQQVARKKLERKHRINHFHRKPGETREEEIARTQKRRKAMWDELRTEAFTAEQRAAFDRGVKAVEKYLAAHKRGSEDEKKLRAELDKKLTTKLGPKPKRPGATRQPEKTPHPDVEVF
jgi:RNA polymerase sigma factor (sigma-70 family)